MSHKVVIIGHGYLSRLALIRSLGQAGCDVTVIVTMYGPVVASKPVDCYSKYVNQVFYCNAKDEKGLITILKEHCTSDNQKVVIIPDSDYSAAFVDKHREDLVENFVFPHIKGPLHIEELMDKERQKILAREIGIKTPNTTVLHIRSGVIPDLEKINYPCFTKALTTMGGGKQCFRRCANKDDLVYALDHFANGGNADILVEDYIEIENEYAVVGLSDGESVLIPGIIQFVDNCQCHLGIARRGKIIPLAGFESLIEMFKAFVLKTHFVGLFDIDFLFSKGEYYFCEMNFRFGGSGYAYTKAGVNLPSLYVSMMTDQLDLNDVEGSVAREMTFVNERMLVDDLLSMNISIPAFNRSIRTADIGFIHDDEDSEPERLFQRTVKKAKLKHLAKRVLKKR